MNVHAKDLLPRREGAQPSFSERSLWRPISDVRLRLAGDHVYLSSMPAVRRGAHQPYPFTGYGVPSRWAYPATALSATMSMSGYKQRSRGSELAISSTLAGRPDLFTISDSGVGIPGDRLEAVFERFFQVTTNDRRGQGLGLYISKCIVQGHGGRIWAESTIGVGSAFPPNADQLASSSR